MANISQTPIRRKEKGKFMSTSSEQPTSDSFELPPETPAVPALPSPPAGSVVLSTPVRDAMSALNPLMRQAFVLTTQGMPPKTIIDEVGISRTTLHHWKKYNPKFRAALSAWHQDQVQSTQLGVVSMLPDAVETIRKEIKHDAKLAFKVVEKAGGFAPPPTGCISPKQVRQEIKLELRREKLRARKRLEKVHVQEVNQRAQELEDKIEADRIDKIRKMDPAEVHRQREMNARIERMAEDLRAARKIDPDYVLDAKVVRAMLNPEEFQEERIKEQQQRKNAGEALNGHA